MAGVTKEEISRAKELDLLTYFKLVEPGNLKLVGKEYRHKVHSSLTISKDSLWCWHCIGLHGRTALKYLIDVEKVPYVEAVREINRIQGGVVHSSQPVSLPQPHAEPEAPRDFKLPEPDTNSYSAMAYLRGRCIHPNVLAFCRREGILYQTSFKNHPNCVFVGRNGEGVAKGGSLRGCTQLQFRRDIPGSKKIYPFYIQASTKADTVEVYEAPIDAMSGASLKLMQHTGPWRSVHYLALGGTDYAALDAFLKYFPAVCKIVLCLDNDNAGESNPLTEEILSLIPENKEPLDTPTQVTSEQIKELTPTMTREDVLSLLGDTQDVGSGIYIYLYEVDQQYLLRIPFASDEAQLGVTGEDLLKALVPISGDIAPMVYVNDTLYQIVDSQPNFADEKSSFNLLGKIENTVSSSEEPKENFQANDDIVGAAVYQYGDNIVVEFEGKYWLYEHYHNTDFDGNSD